MRTAESRCGLRCSAVGLGEASPHFVGLGGPQREVSDVRWAVDRLGQWANGRGLPQGSVRPMPVVEGFELAERVKEVALVPDQGAVQEFAPAGLYPALP